MLDKKIKAKRFLNYILKHNPKIPALPLVRTISADKFRDILDEGKLKTEKCKVFNNEQLLYLYYGRPAYRIESDSDPTSINASYPVCFILDPNCIKVAKRVFPFDSGAYMNKLFSKTINPEKSLEDFLIEPNSDKPENIPHPETAGSVVSAFYENNADYYYGKPKDNIKYSVLDYEVEAYCELIKTKSQTVYDDRRSTIEIQIDKEIILSKKTLMAVALPETYLEDDEIKKRIIEEWEAEILDYGAYHICPSHSTAAIMEKVRVYLKGMKYL